MLSSSGSGCSSSSWRVIRTNPGVQKPHCRLPHSMNASCTASSRLPSSMVDTSPPSANVARYRQPDTARPFTTTVQQPQRPCPQLSRAPKRSEEHTSELQSHHELVCRLLLEKKKQ